MYISNFVLFTDETLIIKDLNPSEMYIPQDYSDNTDFFKQWLSWLKWLIHDNQKNQINQLNPARSAMFLFNHRLHRWTQIFLNNDYSD